MLQNRTIHLVCELQYYDHVSQCWARLGWLLIDQFVQYRSVLAMFYQHYLGDGILFNPSIEFGN